MDVPFIFPQNVKILWKQLQNKNRIMLITYFHCGMIASYRCVNILTFNSNPFSVQIFHTFKISTPSKPEISSLRSGQMNVVNVL